MTLLALAVEGQEAHQSVPSSSDESYIRGIVHDQDGVPVADALVLPLPYGGKPRRTSKTGTFELPGPSNERRIEWVLARHPDRSIAGVVACSGTADLLRMILKPGVTLKGRVLNPKGVPIEKAKLNPRVYLRALAFGFGQTTWPASRADGSFEIEALPLWPVSSSYRVHISADGYGYALTPRRSFSSSGPKVLGDVILQPADRSVGGTVFDESDNPVLGATVGISGEGQPSRAVQTDDLGLFHLDGICKGLVTVWAQISPGYSGYDEAESGVDDLEIYIRPRLECMLPPKSPPALLIGKPLPSLAQLYLPVNEGEIKGKSILLCFVRLEQSSSRQCVRQLAQKYELLKKRGISVMAVQTWPFNEAQFKRWLKRNHIHFPVSLLQEEREQTPEERATYLFGVQNRIPWSILTDQDHIVRFEGFDLEMLETNLKEISDSQRKVNSN
jgi:hypothetical protein